MSNKKKSDEARTPGRNQPESLFAPWRSSYMALLKQQEECAKAGGAPAGAAEKSTCFLSEYWLHPECDDANHVIVRTGNRDTGRGGMIMLNRYPYANGHLLVALGDGRSRLLDYSLEQRAELWSLVDLATELVERTLEPQGVNVGLNQGAAAGAGVPEHVHVHVVPRWSGDVNFLSVVGQVRVIPSALEEMAGRYREVWRSIGVRE